MGKSLEGTPSGHLSPFVGWAPQPQRHKVNQNCVPEMTAILVEPCSSRAMRSASSMRSMPKPWCWKRVGSLALTGTTLPYTCSSRTMEQCPPASSGRKVVSAQRRRRSKPTRMSWAGSSYARNVSQPPLAT